MLHDFFHCCPLMLNEQANRIRCFDVPVERLQRILLFVISREMSFPSSSPAKENE